MVTCSCIVTKTHQFFQGIVGETNYTNMFKPFSYILVTFTVVSWISIRGMSKADDSKLALQCGKT